MTKAEDDLADNRRLFGCAIGAWIMPTAVRSDEASASFGPHVPRLYGEPAMVLENPIHHFPCGFHRILAGEQCPIAFHCVPQEPFVR